MRFARTIYPVVGLVVLFAGCSLDSTGTVNLTSGSSGFTSTSGTGGNGADGTGGAGGVGGGGGQGGSIEAMGPIRYPAGQRHSPWANSVVDKGKSILALGKGRKDIFAKVGDSNTVNVGFLNCFTSNDIKLGAKPELQPTIDYFKQTLADGAKTSFNRKSLAAEVGWSSGDLLSGAPNPTSQELTAITPAFAVIMLGTNDTFPQGIEPFGNNMLRLVDMLTAQGVIPMLTTIPPRADTVEATALVPEMNAIVRAVAQARQVPMFDLFGALELLADGGLVNDGIHLQIYSEMGSAHACWFGMNGLTGGMNQRNLITLEALDKARRFWIANEVPEARPPEMVGNGTWESPYEIDALPFVDNRDTEGVTTSAADKYSCSMADESGPEIVYRLQLDTQKKLRIRVIDDGSVDIDVHLMKDPGGADNCIGRHDKVLDISAGPGTFWISADTFVDGAGTKLAGPYLMTIVELAP